MRRAILSVAACLLMGFGACSGEGEIGDECGATGVKDGECVDGSICGDRGDGELACLKSCDDQADCSATEECNGVSGANEKGCRTAN